MDNIYSNLHFTISVNFIHKQTKINIFIFRRVNQQGFNLSSLLMDILIVKFMSNFIRLKRPAVKIKYIFSVSLFYSSFI